MSNVKSVLVSSKVAAECEAPPGATFVTPAGEVGAVDAAFLSMDLSESGELPAMAGAIEGGGVRWVHVGWAGVDHPWFGAMAARGVTLTSSSGAGALAVAHHAVAGMLAVRRGLVEAARRATWQKSFSDDVDGTRAVVLGMGPIGTEVARLLLAFGVDPVGVRRTPAGDEPCRTVGLGELDDVLDGADALVIALPSTPSTHHIVDRRRLALLAPRATVVNVGRGDLVDEAALVDALRDGKLGGAALDVFEAEPLPDDSPLWHMPSVLVTSHVAGLTAGTERRARDQFLDNLRRWLTGTELCNVVPADRLRQ